MLADLLVFPRLQNGSEVDVNLVKHLAPVCHLQKQSFDVPIALVLPPHQQLTRSRALLAVLISCLRENIDERDYFVLWSALTEEIPVDMDSIAFQAQLALMLRDRLRGTTADLNDHTVAYWNGHEVVGVRLDDKGGGSVSEEFVFGEVECRRLHETLIEWMAAPRYSVRAEIIDLLDKPGL
jgi:hypothetical protein